VFFLRCTSPKTWDNTDQREENHGKVLASSYLSAVYYCYRAGGGESTGHCCIFFFLRFAPVWGPGREYSVLFERLLAPWLFPQWYPKIVQGTTAVQSENGTNFGDFGGAARNFFLGTWTVGAPVTVTDQTIFFTESGGGVSDILEYHYRAMHLTQV